MIGRLRLHYETLGSTNDLARDLGLAGYPDGTVVVAAHQSRGRGRLGRQWEAPPQAALLCSTLVRPAPAAHLLPALTMAAALATLHACRAVGAQGAVLKWPNDVLVPAEPAAQRLAKVAGVLIEAGGSQAIVGIGVNVRAAPPSVVTATHLSAATGRLVATADVLAALVVGLDEWIGRLRDGQARGVVQAWRRELVTLGQRVQVTAADGVFEGMAESVDDEGGLWLVTPAGRRRVLAGDVTLGLAAG